MTVAQVIVKNKKDSRQEKRTKNGRGIERPTEEAKGKRERV